MSARLSSTIALGAWMFVHGAVQAMPACTPDGLKRVLPRGATITLVHSVSETSGVPAHCLLEGTLPTEQNTLRFRIGLPRNWNRMFLFEGAGGMVGLLVPIDVGLKRGYAVATTDTGHQGTPVDVGWALNSLPKKIDWAYRAVHVTTVGAKSVVRAYYGEPIRRAFLEGMSNGGRQGLMEAQRYPDDYDGIIAGAPALAPTVGLLGWIWNLQVLAASPSKLTPEDFALIGKSTRDRCDGIDGLVDHLIEDPRWCEVPYDDLACHDPNGTACLDETKIASLRKLWNKPMLEDGQVLFSEEHGYEDDSSVWSWYAAVPGARSQQAVGLDILRNMFLDDPQRDLLSFDTQRDGPRVIRKWSAVVDATNPDLTPYLRRGAKLLLWQGWADAAVPARYTIDYFWRARAVAQQRGLSAQAYDRSVRLFMVPAMGHGPGIGPWPTQDELLGTMEKWSESGIAPAAIVAQQRDANGDVARSRPLCPLPLVARYMGSGSVNDASSFHCVDSDATTRLSRRASLHRLKR